MKKVFPILMTALATLFFLFAYQTHLSFMQERTLYRSSYSTPPEDISPLMAFTTVALGGFRGIIADILWMRSLEMQTEGRFFELAQLGEWIAKLDPHFIPIWGYQAWNMAYNISNLFPDPEDRWRWIQHGIHLLRDEGLKLNPGNPELYWELAWLYQHKIGYVMDSSHWYYKMRLAMDMMNFFEGERPDYTESESNQGLLRLREEYKMTPAIMKNIENRYGAIDWRHSAAHSLYWAYVGREQTSSATDAIKCERTVVQSLSQLFLQGTMFFDPEAGLFVTTPNLDFISGAIAGYEEALKRYDTFLFHFGYANFLIQSTLTFSFYGKDEDARILFDILSERYNEFVTDIDYELFIKRFRSIDFSGIDSDLATAMVEGDMFQAILKQAEGEEQLAVQLRQSAELSWNKFINSRISEDHRYRTGLQTPELLLQMAIMRAKRESEERGQ